MKKGIAIVVCALLLNYFLFTSGLVFEASGSTNVGGVDMPYSIALSGERTGILEMYSKGDVSCAKWLATSPVCSGSHIPLYVDYNAAALLSEYIEWSEFRPLQKIEGLDLEKTWIVQSQPPGEYMLFLTSWNTRNEKMVMWGGAMLREYLPLPDLSDATVMHDEGDAVVYYVR